MRGGLGTARGAGRVEGAGVLEQWLRVKSRLPVQKTQKAQSLSREDPLELEMAAHSSIPAWTIHGKGSLVGQSMGSRSVGRERA